VAANVCTAPELLVTPPPKTPMPDAEFGEVIVNAGAVALKSMAPTALVVEIVTAELAPLLVNVAVSALPGTPALQLPPVFQSLVAPSQVEFAATAAVETAPNAIASADAPAMSRSRPAPFGARRTESAEAAFAVLRKAPISVSPRTNPRSGSLAMQRQPRRASSPSVI
jgi:hypothetical protein